VRDLIQLGDIHAAWERIHRQVHRTPTLPSRQLGRRFGVKLFFKAELFQKTGSFKVRGVLNKLHGLSPQKRGRGFVSMSAGNHAAALAWASSLIGAPSAIVMPEGAARSKLDATRGYGGEVVLTRGDLMEVCNAVRDERGMTMVHPFDDPAIMAGHGTMGLEIVEDLPDVDLLIVPVGGGGLISGTAAAVKALAPNVRIVGVEPVGAEAMTRGLAAGRPVQVERPPTIADGLAAPFAGEHTLRHVQELVDDVVLVSDTSIAEALRLIMTRTKLAAEPSGAAALAALLEGKVDLTRARRVVCVISGGNVDLDVLKGLL